MSDISNFIALAIGRRNTGKTKYVLGDDELNIPSIIDPYFEKGMKVLIVDTFPHPSYKTVTEIDKRQIPKWGITAPGVYRVIASTPEEMKEVLELIAKYFWNGLLIFEDAFKYIRYKINAPLAAIIGNSKQQNVDIIFMYHSWKFVPLDLIIYLDMIEMFKVNSPPSKREEKEFADVFHKVMKCYNEVMAHESNYYHQTVHVTQ